MSPNKLKLIKKQKVPLEPSFCPFPVTTSSLINFSLNCALNSFLTIIEDLCNHYFIMTSNPDDHSGVIAYLEPDILECAVTWALESITTNKASGCDGIPVELFQILKDDAVKVLHSTSQQNGKTQQWPQDWKRSVFIPIPKKGNAKKMLKLLHNCIQLTHY